MTRPVTVAQTDGTMVPLGRIPANSHAEMLWVGPHLWWQSGCCCFSETMTHVPGRERESKTVSVADTGMVTVGPVRGGRDTEAALSAARGSAYMEAPV